MTSLADWSRTRDGYAVTDPDMSLTVLVRQWLAIPDAVKARDRADAARAPQRRSWVPDAERGAQPHRHRRTRMSVLMSSLGHVGSAQAGKHRS